MQNVEVESPYRKGDFVVRLKAYIDSAVVKHKRDRVPTGSDSVVGEALSNSIPEPNASRLRTGGNFNPWILVCAILFFLLVFILIERYIRGIEHPLPLRKTVARIGRIAP